MSFIGALFKLDEKVFFIILGIALIFSSISLIYQSFYTSNTSIKKLPPYVSYLVGAGIGLLSGLVGIGGGIFLAPLLNHLKWGKPIKIAALSAFFILVNSISGILGLAISKTLEISWPITIVLLGAVLAGGQLGVRISLIKASPRAIKLGTAILVLVVGVRVLITRGFM
jgi:uncharacterized membrane protein YfcA